MSYDTTLAHLVVLGSFGAQGILEAVHLANSTTNLSALACQQIIAWQPKRVTRPVTGLSGEGANELSLTYQGCS